MTESEKYIQSLESLVCFYASAYEACKSEYQSKHFKTCARQNPNRRELTEAEKSELMRFPQIQGSSLILATEKLSKIRIENKLPIKKVVEIIKQKHK